MTAATAAREVKQHHRKMTSNERGHRVDESTGERPHGIVDSRELFQ